MTRVVAFLRRLTGRPAPAPRRMSIPVTHDQYGPCTLVGFSAPDGAIAFIDLPDGTQTSTLPGRLKREGCRGE